MNGENPLPPWARHILIGIGLFVSGAILAFGYSYRPLHGALSWQVEQLESRLNERNQENLKLSDTLAKQESADAMRIDPETLAQVKRELHQTKRVLAQAEKDLRRAEGKRKDANASAAKWRKRFKEIEGRPSPVAAVAPMKGSTADATQELTASTTVDAAKAATQPIGPTDASAAVEPNSAAETDESQAGAERGIIPRDFATEPEAR
jgi:hypothetical protein